MNCCIGIVNGRINSEKEVILIGYDGVEIIAKYKVLKNNFVRYDHLDERIGFIFGDVEGDKFVSPDYELMKSSGKGGILTNQSCLLYMINGEEPLNVINFKNDDILELSRK